MVSSDVRVYGFRCDASPLPCFPSPHLRTRNAKKYMSHTRRRSGGLRATGAIADHGGQPAGRYANQATVVPDDSDRIDQFRGLELLIRQLDAEVGTVPTCSDCFSVQLACHCKG